MGEQRPESAPVEERVRWWLETAEDDLRTAEVLLANGVHANAAFHLQQAAEKALKAVLHSHGEREPTHSGLALLVALERHGEQFPNRMAGDLRRLDRCYIDSRYPNGVGGRPEEFYDRAMVEELMQCCRRVMDWVKSRLS